MSYESPIEINYGEMQTAYENGILRAVWKYDIHCDKEELLKALAYDRDQYRKGYEDAKLRWIPCSERLPEEDGQYLITVKYVHVDGYDDIYAEHGDWADGKWDMFCFGHCGEVESILAWMPLPKPYEGRKE